MLAFKSCVKNNLRQQRASEPPLGGRNSRHLCMICVKPTATQAWNQLCLTCGWFACATCAEAGRVIHRHQLYWVKIMCIITYRLMQAAGGKTCSTCGRGFAGVNYEYLECVGCRNFWCCVKLCMDQKRLPLEHAFCGGEPSKWELRIGGR